MFDVFEICITNWKLMLWHTSYSLLLCGMVWICIFILGLSALSEMELKLIILCIHDQLGHVVVQLVEVLCYKPDGHRFNYCWFHWNFSLTHSFQPHCSLCVDSASNRNKYQEYFLGGRCGWCVGLITLPLSCTNCDEIWQLQPHGTLRACPGL